MTTLAQIRGSWFAALRSSLERHVVLVECEAQLPMVTRKILRSTDPAAWFDEGHAVAIYEAVAAARGLPACREVGRDAARFAMVGAWRDLMHALVGFIGGTPRMGFEQLPVLWNATRREAGELRCVESSPRHAITELRGFPYLDSTAWVEVWIGHHLALLRQLGFTGTCTREGDDPSVLRMRTVWSGALADAPTNPGSVK